MFSEEELADLKRCVEIAVAALANVSTRVDSATQEDAYVKMSRQWLLENISVVLRAEEAIERERNRG